MAARTTGQAKPSERREESETARSRAAGARKKAAAAPAKKGAAKAAAKKTAAKKATPKRPGARKTARGGTKRAANNSQTETQMLAEQNAALKAELEQAKSRIAELEALNRDVINRIDWVIDSLQTVVDDKR